MADGASGLRRSFNLLGSSLQCSSRIIVVPLLTKISPMDFFRGRWGGGIYFQLTCGVVT